MDEKKKGPGDWESRGPRKQQQKSPKRVNDAGPRAAATPSFSEAEALAKAGYPLIPLRPRDKIPKDKAWTRVAYSNERVIEEARSAGLNLGVRLRSTDLVVDADPRNYPEGRDSLSELARDTGLNLDLAPHTITGGGGHHYYLRKPAELERSARFEPARSSEHRSDQTLVPTAGLEPAWLSPPAPRTGVSAVPPRRRRNYIRE